MSVITYEELKIRIEQIKFAFIKPISMKEHLNVVFVFGKADEKNNILRKKYIPFYKNKTSISNRTKFLTYVEKKQGIPFNFITIEALYDDLKQFSSGRKGVTAKRTALVELELRAIKQAYSLVIFPESVGSYAELGYFTAIPETQEKIYVANNFNFSHERSYLNHLIDVIHNDRELRPLYKDFSSKSQKVSKENFDTLVNQLSEDYNSNTYIKKFRDSPMFPLAITYEIIRLLPILPFKQLELATKTILDEIDPSMYKTDDFTVNISLLIVSKLIQRYEHKNQIYFVPIDKEYPFIDFNLDERSKAKLELLRIGYKEIDDQRLAK